MKRDPRVLLDDVIEASEEIVEYTSDMDMQAYLESTIIRRAVERCFTIIGEALNQLDQQEPDLAARIINLRNVVDFRNVLTHGYHKVDNEDVWDIITDHLPILYRTVCDLRKEFV